ncbi:transglycosylase family protein [Streptomyces sp. NPDC002580]|uniref:transglycosylase family protein n=1 Tax=Streptomyces sp. NPDC002580 TaxID=3364653 RepID=UPI0036BE46E6
MLSGNGRHRRPRQAPALIVAAGVAGSAIAIPLLAASSASAADGNTWDRVAQCESGGAWSSDSENGYYGGLQLSQDDWEAHGGLEYAPQADQASRSQQIAVAERLLDDRGLAAWPTCGPLSGLGTSSGDVQVDTGVEGDAGSESGGYGSSGLSTEPDSTPSYGSSASGDSSDATPEPSASQSSDSSDKTATEGDKSGKSGKKGASSGASDDESTGAGRHRGDSAAERAADSRGDVAVGRHASRDVLDDLYVTDGLSGSSDSLLLDSGWGNLSTADEDAADAGPGLVVPGRSIAVTVETLQQ